MPIKILSAAEAYANSKSPYSSWPMDAESQQKRLLPIAKPRFEPSFKIRREDLVFTVGSCFARNIEKQLANEGFDYASKDFDIPEEIRDFHGELSASLNKFVVFSILNELRWALDGNAQFPENGFVEVRNDKWIDPHLHHAFLPSPLEHVKKRRELYRNYFALAAKAKVFVMTLGLAEAWYDTYTGLYLNAMPHRSARDRAPDRFEFHLLDYNQILAALEEIHELLTTYGDPELKLLVTVSPVALGTSFSGSDALIGNTYSKSVQRAAVAAFVNLHENVDYFPSYESVTLSDRSRAWKEDQAHASDEIVRYNVLQMMGSYMEGVVIDGQDGSDAADRADKMALALTHLKEAEEFEVNGQKQKALAAYRAAADTAPTEGLILLKLGKFLFKIKNFDEAVRVTRDSTLNGSEKYSGFYHLAKFCRAANRFDEGYEAVAQALVYEPTRPGVIFLKATICMALKKYDEAMGDFEKLLSARPDYEPALVGYAEAAEAAGESQRREAFLKRIAAPETSPTQAPAVQVPTSQPVKTTTPKSEKRRKRRAGR